MFKDGVHAFYANGLLRAFVLALITIFVPVFVYERATATYGSVTIALLIVALYFFVQRLVTLIVDVPVSHIIEKIGFRRSVGISVIFLMAHLSALIAMRTNFAYIWVATMCLSLNLPFYWIARDSALSQDAASQKMGRAMAGIAVLEKIAALAGPFVAGMIILRWGFGTLFIIALVLLAVSAVPLMWMPHHTHKNGVSFTGFWLWVTGRRYFHQAVSQAGAAMEDYGLGVFWPLSLFIIGFNAGTLGAVFSGVAIVSVAVQYVSGIVFDRLRRRGHEMDEVVFGFATVGTALVWLVRLFISTVFQVVAVDSFGQLFQTVYYGFQSDYAHLGGKRMGSIAFWVYLQMTYSIVALFAFGLMAVGVYFGVWKELLFLSTAWWVLVSVVQARETNLH